MMERKKKTSLISLKELPDLMLLSEFRETVWCSESDIRTLIHSHAKQCDCDIRNLVDADGKSLLHIACERMGFRVVKMLIEGYHFDPNEQDTNGNTALHIACEEEKYQIVQYLRLLPTYNPNIRNNKGMIAHQMNETIPSKSVHDSTSTDTPISPANLLSPVIKIEGKPFLPTLLDTNIADSDKYGGN